MFYPSSVQAFFSMLRGLDEVKTVENCPVNGVFQNGDLLFLADYSEGDNGFIGLVDDGDGKPCFQRVYIDGEKVRLCGASYGQQVEEFERGCVKILGKVTGLYRKLPDHPERDCKYDDMPIFKSIKQEHISVGYRISWAAAKLIEERSRGVASSCIYDAYAYGFLRGRRAERKKKKQR